MIFPNHNVYTEDPYLRFLVRTYKLLYVKESVGTTIIPVPDPISKIVPISLASQLWLRKFFLKHCFIKTQTYTAIIRIERDTGRG